MKTLLKRHKYFLIAIIVTLPWFLVATITFSRSLNKMQRMESNSRFEEISVANASEVNFSIQRYLNILSSAVEFIEKYDDIKSDEVMAGLTNIAKDNDFKRLSIDFTDGFGYTSDGYVVDTTVLNSGSQTMLGNPFILDVMEDSIDDMPMVNFLVPIKSIDGSYKTSLRGSITTQHLTSIFDKTFVNAGGYFCVVDGNGRYVAQSDSKHQLFGNESSFFKAIESVTFESGYSLTQMKELFDNKKSGVIKYSYKGQGRTCYIEPISINNWMVMTIVPHEFLDKSIQQHAKNVALFVIQLVLVFSFFILCIYMTQKQAKEKALLNEKCFKALSEHTNNVVLEWDFEKNKINAMSNFEILFGRKSITVNNSQDALSAKAVHNDDRDAFSKIFQTIQKGNPVNNARFRIADQDGFYHWCSLSGLVIKDKKGKPFKAIGSLKNIEEELRKENDLRMKAENDQLTGLYNKVTTENLIKDALFGQRYKNYKYALFIIDIDNFKNVNDKLGHLYGDTVLSSLSEDLRQLFRTNDVVGRVGGDEFFVLIQDYTDNNLLIKKANLICSAFRKTYVLEKKIVKISASIGIAIFPEHGKDYETLYKNADIALYDTKAKGKDGYTFYSGQHVASYDSVRVTNDIVVEQKIKDSAEALKNFVFHLLYETPNTEAAITAVLRLTTETFHCSRAYIFEFNPEKTFLNNTYEWCVPGISPEIDNLKGLPVTSFAVGLAAMRKTGFFIIDNVDHLPNGVTKDLLQQQDIKSLIHGAIMVDGEMQAFIGFDNCESEYIPTESELEMTTTICKMIGTFLTRMRATTAEKEAKTLLLDILSNKNALIYVIVPETFEILYENDALIDYSRKKHLGEKCYQTFCNRSSPCDDCPCKKLSPHILTTEMNMYNQKLCQNVHIVASRLEWTDSETTYLLRCTTESESN